jgi:hypothetical protein
MKFYNLTKLNVKIGDTVHDPYTDTRYSVVTILNNRIGAQRSYYPFYTYYDKFGIDDLYYSTGVPISQKFAQHIQKNIIQNTINRIYEIS